MKKDSQRARTISKKATAVLLALLMMVNVLVMAVPGERIMSAEAAGIMDLGLVCSGTVGTISWKFERRLWPMDEWENEVWDSYDGPYGVLTFTGTGEIPGIRENGEAVMPWQWQVVNETGEYSDICRCYIDKIVIGEGITGIGYGSFCYTNTREVELPSTLEYIREKAFYHCSVLSSISIPSDVKSIGRLSFGSCNLGEVSFPGVSRLETIDYGAFSNNSDIKINIPASVKSIGAYAFYSDYFCEITLPEDSVLEVIGEHAFERCRGVSDKGIVGLTEITLPRTIKEIGKDAFSESGLSTVTFLNPSSLSVIPAGCFYSCRISEVVLPDSIKEIGSSAFADNDIENLRVPYGVTGIDSNAFENNKLKTVNLPLSLEYIDMCAFRENNLEWVTIPYKVELIGYEAFYGNRNMKRVYIQDNDLQPASLKIINMRAFAYCGLTTVTIPKTVTILGDNVFLNDILLEEIKVDEENTIFSDIDGVLANKEKTELICCPSGRKGEYTIPASIKELGRGVFQNCCNLEKLVLPSTLEKIVPGSINFSMDEISAIDENYNFSFNVRPKMREIVVENKMLDWGEYIDYYGSIKPSGAKVVFDSTNDDYFVCSELRNLIFKGYNHSSAEAFAAHWENTFIPLDGGEWQIPIRYNDGLAYVKYSDGYFDTDNTIYNHSLARLGLGLSAAAYNYGSTEQEQNIRQTLFAAGFDDEDMMFRGYNQPTQEESIGSAIASKKITTDDGEQTLVVIAVRSGGYENEWYGNFKVGGNPTCHSNFSLAAIIIGQRMNSYLVDHPEIDKSKMKVFITGFSRGGAVANLTAANFIDAYPNAEIYGYTFATPKGTTDKFADSVKYNCIFNIVTQDDVVPQVVFKQWGFKRYGVNKFLPTLKENAAYPTMITPHRNTFQRIDTTGAWDEVDSFVTVYQENAVDNLTQILADAVGSQEKYHEDYEETLAKVVGGMMAGADSLDVGLDEIIDLISLGKVVSEAVVDEFMYDTFYYDVHNDSYFKAADLIEERDIKLADYIDWSEGVPDRILIKAIKGYLRAVIDACTDAGLQTNATINYLYKNVESFFDDKRTAPFYTTHEITNYLSWMLTFQESELFISDDFDLNLTAQELTERGFVSTEMDAIRMILDIKNIATKARKIATRKIELSGVKEVSVFDEAHNLHDVIEIISSYKDGTEEALECSENKVFYLPADAEFNIEMLAQDTGKISYTVTELDDEGEVIRKVDYVDVPAVKNQKFTSTVEEVVSHEKQTIDVLSYSLPEYELKNESETIEPDSVVDTETIEKVSVTLDNAEGGIVIGNGKYIKGEDVTVSAVPLYGYEFIGWFDGCGNELTDLERTSDLVVNDDVVLFARFAPIALDSAEFAEKELELGVGETAFLSVEMLPKENCEIGDMTFVSSNADVATVDVLGNITAIAGGEAEITVNVAGKTDVCTVKVIEKKEKYVFDATFTGKKASIRIVNADRSTDISGFVDHTVEPFKPFEADILPGIYEVTLSKSGCLSYVDKGFAVPNDSFPDNIVLCAGDINADMAINAKDQAAMTSVFGTATGTEAYTISADFNEDGYINAKDRADIVANFGKTGTVVE